MTYSNSIVLSFLAGLAAWTSVANSAKPPQRKKGRLDPDPYNAAEKGDLKSVKLHVARNPKIVNKLNKRGYTLLHYAAHETHVDMIKFLLKNGADVERHGTAYEHGSGERPLHMAAKSHHGGFKAAKLLLDHGADPHATVDMGFHKLKAPNPEIQKQYNEMKGPSALDFAAFNRGAKLVKLLLEKKVSPYTTPKRYGRYVTTSLHWACSGSGAEVFRKDPANRGNGKVIKLLVAAIKDVNIKAGLAETPLHRAVKFGEIETIEFLLTTYPKLEIDAKDSDDNTALHLAVHALGSASSVKRGVAVVRLLLKHKASRTIKNSKGQTPLARAKATGQKELIKLLREHRCSVSQVLSHGDL